MASTEIDEMAKTTALKFIGYSKPRVSDNFSEDARIILKIGDSYEFLKTLPSNSIKLIITSPPYNVGKEYESTHGFREYLSDQRRVISELCRVLMNDGSVCWEVGNYIDRGEIFPLDFHYHKIFKEDFNLKLRNRIIWHFEHGLHCSKRFSGRYETILWYTKTDDYVFNLDNVRVPSKYPGKKYFKGPKRGQFSCNPKGKNPSDIWEVVERDWQNEIWEIPNVKANHIEKTAHPCQFPIELVERCVLALTNEDDWVLDPYAGVGSALVAGLIHNRRVVGVDKEPKYIEIAKERITSYFHGKLRKRPLGKPIYEPTEREKISQKPIEWEKWSE